MKARALFSFRLHGGPNVIWLGLRQLVAVVLMSLAGLEEPLDALAADAPRYEVELKIKVDTKNQSMSATTLRLILVRARATAQLGSKGLVITMLPDHDDPEAQRLVVRGTTVPKLIERLIGTSATLGWARQLGPDEVAAIGTKSRSKGKKTRYEESTSFPASRWGAADTATVKLEAGSDERAVQAAAIGRDESDGSDTLWLSLEAPGPDHRALIVAGMLVPADDVEARAHVSLPLPQAPEEQAAILGLIRFAPAMLPHPVLVLDTQIRPMPADAGPPTLTRRVGAVAAASAEELEAMLGDPSPLVRRRVVLAAAAKKARRVLEKSFGDPDPMVAGPALAALLAAGSVPSVTELAAAAASACYDLTRPALAGLMAGGEAGAAAAIKALRRNRAVEAALPEIKAARFREALPIVERLASGAREPAVRTEAAAVAGSLGRR